MSFLTELPDFSGGSVFICSCTFSVQNYCYFIAELINEKSNGYLERRDHCEKEKVHALL